MVLAIGHETWTVPLPAVFVLCCAPIWLRKSLGTYLVSVSSEGARKRNKTTEIEQGKEVYDSRWTSWLATFSCRDKPHLNHFS
ncbi:hypothetical protein LY76DRAFT_590082 [Colletotrichum caudatum]|nr:hypothetical protein LY76DRAFT_590082 [Colletotrichum caudatum]